MRKLVVEAGKGSATPHERLLTTVCFLSVDGHFAHFTGTEKTSLNALDKHECALGAWHKRRRCINFRCLWGRTITCQEQKSGARRQWAVGRSRAWKMGHNYGAASIAETAANGLDGACAYAILIKRALRRRIRKSDPTNSGCHCQLSAGEHMTLTYCAPGRLAEVWAGPKLARKWSKSQGQNWSWPYCVGHKPNVSFVAVNLPLLLCQPAACPAVQLAIESMGHKFNFKQSLCLMALDVHYPGRTMSWEAFFTWPIVAQVVVVVPAAVAVTPPSARWLDYNSETCLRKQTSMYLIKCMETRNLCIVLFNW